MFDHLARLQPRSASRACISPREQAQAGAADAAAQVRRELEEWGLRLAAMRAPQTICHASSVDRDSARANLRSGSTRIHLHVGFSAADCRGLRGHGTDNTKATTYAAAMTAGAFGLPTTPIQIRRGVIWDGNHRIAAVREHGATLPRVVVHTEDGVFSPLTLELTWLVMAEQCRELEAATSTIDLNPAALALLERWSG